jgi:hypothetical protein
VYWFVRKVGPGLVDGFGGVSLRNLESAFRIYGVPEGDRIWMTEKIMAFYSERQKKDGEE